MKLFLVQLLDAVPTVRDFGVWRSRGAMAPVFKV